MAFSNQPIQAWCKQWRAKLAAGGTWRQLRDFAEEHCPWLPAAAHTVPTKMLVRAEDRVPLGVLYGAPFLTMGSHEANDLVLAGDTVQELHVSNTPGWCATPSVPCRRGTSSPCWTRTAART